MELWHCVPTQRLHGTDLCDFGPWGKMDQNLGTAAGGPITHMHAHMWMHVHTCTCIGMHARRCMCTHAHTRACTEIQLELSSTPVYAEAGNVHIHAHKQKHIDIYNTS